MARLTRAALADGKVVALPGAATRRPENGRYAEQRHAAVVARNGSPFPARFRFPGQREAEKLATDFDAMEHTPEGLVLTAILKTMDAEAYAKAMFLLAATAAGGGKLAGQAFALAQTSRMTIGQTNDFNMALRKLRGEERK